jgi:GH24 family phage-related lysozyme (muramidase)
MKTILLTLILGFLSLQCEAAFLKSGGLEISKEGYQLILNHEVGGGPVYYTKRLQRPCYPGGASGVTIGVGYDLGYNTREQIDADWAMLPSETRNRLKACAGLKGAAARRLIPGVRDIIIPWDAARQVFDKNTIPRFAKITNKSYPGTDKLHPHIQSAHLSWVFNRGGGITKSSRDLEKRLIRRDTPNSPKLLPGHYRASKRIWRGKGLDGLLRRREDEARLIEAGL